MLQSIGIRECRSDQVSFRLIRHNVFATDLGSVGGKITPFASLLQSELYRRIAFVVGGKEQFVGLPMHGHFHQGRIRRKLPEVLGK